MAAIVFGLLQNPIAMKSVTKEVRSAFVSEHEIIVASASNLEYLNAVINEGIRLGPPSSVTVPRVVSAGGATICGQWVPGNVSQDKRR